MNSLEVYGNNEFLELLSVEEKAKNTLVTNDSEYENVAYVIKEVKARQKIVKDFFEPMRIQAKAAYDEVLAKKNSYMKPLENAEKILKGKMGDYLAEKERLRKAKEEELRLAAIREAEKKKAEAEEALRNGDDISSEFARLEAELIEDSVQLIHVDSSEKKVSGVSTKKDWRIKSIDSTKVPAYMNGIELRAVDEKAVLRLIRVSNGEINIPGIEYEETAKLAIRA